MQRGCLTYPSHLRPGGTETCQGVQNGFGVGGGGSDWSRGSCNGSNSFITVTLCTVYIALGQGPVVEWAREVVRAIHHVVIKKNTMTLETAIIVFEEFMFPWQKSRVAR